MPLRLLNSISLLGLGISENVQDQEPIVPMHRPGQDQKTNVVLDEDRKIFDPECQNIDCPECLHGRIYYDRVIGFYCMPCGHEFSTEEIVMLIEKSALTSQSIQDSGKSGRKPIAEIKELPARQVKKRERLTYDVTELHKPEQEAFDS